MSNREKLVKLIHHCTTCEECHDEDIADHLIANGVTVQDSKGVEIDQFKKWIPVTERLPEENTAVLTYRESGIQVEFRWHKGWDNDEFTPCPVTHWTPLPQPPKETT